MSIQTPEELWDLLRSMATLGKEHEIISARDATLRADEREQKRQEVVASLVEEFSKSVSPNAPLWLTVALSADALQPAQPSTHPKAADLAEEWYSKLDERPFTMTIAERKKELAAIIDAAVKPDGWR